MTAKEILQLDCSQKENKRELVKMICKICKTKMFPKLIVLERVYQILSKKTKTSVFLLMTNGCSKSVFDESIVYTATLNQTDQNNRFTVRALSLFELYCKIICYMAKIYSEESDS